MVATPISSGTSPELAYIQLGAIKDGYQAFVSATVVFDRYNTENGNTEYRITSGRMSIPGNVKNYPPGLSVWPDLNSNKTREVAVTSQWLDQLNKYVEQYETECAAEGETPSVEDFSGWLFFTIEEECLSVVPEEENVCFPPTTVG